MNSNFLLIISLLVISINGYNDTFARNTAYIFSKIAYCEEKNVSLWNCKDCQYFPNMKDTQAFHGHHDSSSYCGYEPESDLIVLAYRGSDNLQNWLNSLDYDKVEYHGCKHCKVHKGFYHSFKDTQYKMLNCYDSLRLNHPEAELLVTGHSLGAAESQFLVALLYEQRNVIPDHYYQFESPRVGNMEWANYLNRIGPNNYRIVHNRDPIVHLPPANWGFTHINDEVFYDEDMASYVICDSTESEDCSQGFWFYWIQDHTNLFGLNTDCGTYPKNTSQITITNPLILQSFEELKKNKNNKKYKMFKH